MGETEGIWGKNGYLGEIEAVCGIWEQYGEKEGGGSIEGGTHYGKSKQYGLGGRQVWVGR